MHCRGGRGEERDTRKVVYIDELEIRGEDMRAGVSMVEKRRGT
jgi:hypothetical protein